MYRTFRQLTFRQKLLNRLFSSASDCTRAHIVSLKAWVTVSFIVTFFLVACVHRLIEDFAPSPLDTEYGRLETDVCGHFAVGDNLCWISRSEGVSGINIEVSTMFDGSVNAVASGKYCSINARKLYRNSKPVTFALGDYVKGLEGPCIIDLIMTPRYPGKFDGATRGMRGRVIVMVKDDDMELARVMDRQRRISGFGSMFFDGSALISDREDRSESRGRESDFYVDPGNSSQGKLRVEGCGIDAFMKEYKAGDIGISLRELFKGNLNNRYHCVLYGRFVRSDHETDSVFAVAVEIFDWDTAVLGLPTVWVDENEIKFSSTEPVSFSMIDDEIVVGGSGAVSVNRADFMLRQVTVQGRSILVRVKNGKIVWWR